MRALGSLAADTAGEDDEHAGLGSSLAAAFRLIVGWLSVAIGILNVLVEADRSTGGPDVAYLLFHAVLIVGGIALLGVPWLGRHPGAAGYLAGGVVAAAGLLITAVPVTDTVCCLSAFDVRHGFPFSFLARYDQRGDAGRWHLDGQHLVADVLFWTYAGLIALVVVALLRRLTAGRARTTADGAHPHAEPRAHAAGLAGREQGRTRRAEQPADD